MTLDSTGFTATHYKRRGTTILLFSGLFVTWWCWFVFYSPQQFRSAMEQSDFRKAEMLLKWGVYTAGKNMQVELMRIITRFRSIKGVHVADYQISRISSLGGTNRYIGIININDTVTSNGVTFAVALEWEDKEWRLRVDHPLLPPYVKTAIENHPK